MLLGLDGCLRSLSITRDNKQFVHKSNWHIPSRFTSAPFWSKISISMSNPLKLHLSHPVQSKGLDVFSELLQYPNPWSFSFLPLPIFKKLPTTTTTTSNHHILEVCPILGQWPQPISSLGWLISSSSRVPRWNRFESRSSDREFLDLIVRSGLCTQ